MPPSTRQKLERREHREALEATIDSTVRRLLSAQIEDAVEADKGLTMLMGSDY